MSFNAVEIFDLTSVYCRVILDFAKTFFLCWYYLENYRSAPVSPSKRLNGEENNDETTYQQLALYRTRNLTPQY